MNTTNTRIKKLRKALDLTQQEFASRIGTSANVLTNYETGRRNPSSSVINNICKEFHVNETWMRTGSGEMFVSMSLNDEIAAFVDGILLDETAEFKRRFVAALTHLDEAGWEAMERFAAELVNNHDTAPGPSIDPAQRETPAADQHVPPGYSSRAEMEAEARAEAEEYYQRLLLEKKRAGGSSSSSGGGAETA